MTTETPATLADAASMAAMTEATAIQRKLMAFLMFVHACLNNACANSF